MKVIEKHNRKILAEGRDNGVAYAFTKKIDPKTYETVNPHSPCKDYLNEVVFTENTGIPTKAYGLHYKQKNNIFDKFGYLSMTIMKTTVGTYGYSPSFEADQKHLEANYKNIQKLLNELEDLLGLKQHTLITKAEGGFYVAKVPLEWCKSTPAISLYTLIIRCALTYKGEEDAMTFLQNYNYSNADKGLINPSLPKLKKFIAEKKLPEQPKYNEESAKKGMFTPHNVGIIAYND